MFTRMDATVEQFEMFPDLPMEDLSKKVKTKWQEIEDLSKIVEKHGMLLPIALAADLLDLSRQRVDVLANEGTFNVVYVRGRKFLTANEIADFVALERNSGRPWKAPSSKEIWAMSHKWAKEEVASRKKKK